MGHEQWRLWNKKDSRAFKRSDWEVSYTRSLSLLQWANDNPARKAKKSNKKSKKRKSKSPLRHPRDKHPTKQEILAKLSELVSLVTVFVDDK